MCIGYVKYGMFLVSTPPCFWTNLDGATQGPKASTLTAAFCLLSARTASNLRNGGSTLTSFVGFAKCGRNKQILELFLVGDVSGFLFHKEKKITDSNPGVVS